MDKAMNRLNAWERFLDSISTEGGHLVLWILLTMAGAVILKCGIPYGHEIMVSSITGLGIALKTGARSNFTRQNSVDPPSAPPALPPALPSPPSPPVQ